MCFEYNTLFIYYLLFKKNHINHIIIVNASNSSDANIAM